jgi:hypothetical protein
MIPVFNDEGNLLPGLYTPHLSEFKDRFVSDYPDSKTRISIFSDYINYCNQIINFEIASKNWVDGSFTTYKTDPGDIDIVVHYDALKLNSLQNRESIKDLFLDQLNARKKFQCHTLTVPIYPKHDPRYILTFISYNKWKNWFSQDKITHKPKGLIEFDLSNDQHKQNLISERGLLWQT